MIRALDPADHYRSIYKTLYRIERRHWRSAVFAPANDRGR